MVRVGGLEYTCDPLAASGNRISDMRLNGKSVDAGKAYKVAGWAPVAEGVQGEPIWDVMETYLKSEKTIKARKLNMPTVKNMANNPGMA